MLTILFKSVAQTLLCFGHDPKNGLGGNVGFIAVLHTWDQQLNPHFHLHCLIPGGVMTGDGEKWKPCKNNYLFNQEALSLVFRGKFIEHLTGAYLQGDLDFSGIIAPYKKARKFSELRSRLYSHKWVVNMQEPIKQPEYVLEYLGRYTHRVAISHHRIVTLKDGKVTFTCRNRKTQQIEQKTIEAVEFIRRFLLHILPRGFVRIRQFGFLANRNKAHSLTKLRTCLAPSISTYRTIEETLREMMLTLTGTDIKMCPYCKKGKLRPFLEIPRYTGKSARGFIRSTISSQIAA